MNNNSTLEKIRDLKLTGMYQAARFGGQTSDPRQASSLLNLIRTLLQTRIPSLRRSR